MCGRLWQSHHLHVALGVLIDDRARFKKLKDVADVAEIQGRFALVKHLNKLVTPLLHYIDITLFSEEGAVGSATSADDYFRSYKSAYTEAVALSQQVKEYSFKSAKLQEEKENAMDNQSSAKDKLMLSPRKSLSNLTGMAGAVVAEEAAKVDKDSSLSKTVKTKPAAAASGGSGGEEQSRTTLSSQVHTLKGLYFMSTKQSVFTQLLSANVNADTTVCAVCVSVCV